MSCSPRQQSLIRRTFIDFQQTAEFLERPLIFDRAEGLYLWDLEGRRYFDAIGGIFVAVLGHRPPRVLEAVKRQMDRLTFAPPLHGITEVALDFIEKLGSVSPGNLNWIKGFSGGSESIEAALKFSRQYFQQTGHPLKSKVISNYLSYHGGTLAAMSASGGAKRKVKFEPHMPGFLKAFSPIQLRDRFPSWEETNRFCAGLFEEIIVNENPETVAAVLVEPICNTGGIVTPTEEYFAALRDITRRHNVLLIFDEVLTGFGKTGDMFAAQTFGVVPDILCSGKGLSGAVIPSGAIMVREDLAESFYGRPEQEIQFFHGHTYAGNPLAAAAGIAVIEELVEKRLPEKARRLGERLRRGLEGLKDLGVVREVRGKGVLLGVELVEDPRSNAPFPAGRKLGDALKRTALEHGLILRIDPDWFAVSPPLIAEEADLDELVALIRASLQAAIARVRKGSP
ncbi:MAG TPA: aminotransferase class III-fold pyridoxal phosphate-dependent enzyme [Anaerolineales bacterium]|nr:aminotransferase class III-fold pyridoxal phosphate-dependent enzyme [Anaerolineales bacterium]